MTAPGGRYPFAFGRRPPDPEEALRALDQARLAVAQAADGLALVLARLDAVEAALRGDEANP